MSSVSRSHVARWTTCFSCKIDFHGNKDAFVEHMSEEHADDKVQCCICDEISDSGLEYSMHFIYSHTEEGFENSNKESNETYTCHICGYATKDLSDLNIHANSQHICHKNQENVPSSDSVMTSSLLSINGAVDNNRCPVCLQQFDASLLNDHVNAHFEGDDDVTAPTLGIAATSAARTNDDIQGNTDLACDPDYQLALELDRQEKEALRQAEEKQFRDLQKEYGMDEQGSYKQQGTKAYETAYNKGRITLSQLYNEKKRLQTNENGVEDFNYGLKGLIEKVHESSRRCADILDSYTCTTVEYFGSCPADFGFGCGYRNIQMMISSLKQHEPYRKALFGTGAVRIPSIPKVQSLIEAAWAKGFDAAGMEQLNGKLSNTKKWIGATEACVFLMSFRIRAAVVDFRAPTGADGTHPQMLKWVYEYFKEKRPFTPPLYFQHQGHSRTIVGVERTRSGRFNLLLFDPSAGKAKMQNIKTSEPNSIKVLRKSLADLKKPQFQIVYVKGVIEREEEFEAFKKTMDLTRIPPT